MRSERRRGSARLTLLPGGAGVGESGSAYTTYGCERVDGITSHKILSHQLSVLLSDLERQVEILESKFSEVLGTSLEDTILPAVRLLSTTREDTTKC